MSVPGLLTAHTAGEQTPKRPRGRPPGSKSKIKVAMPVGTPTAQVVTATAAGQKRGRPRKSQTPVSAVARSPVRSPAALPAMPAPEPKRRGRPRKNPIAPPAAPAATATARSPASAAATASPARATQIAAPVPRKRGRPPDPDAAARRAAKAAAAAAKRAKRADASGRPLDKGKRPVGRPRKNASTQSPAGLGSLGSPMPVAQLVSPPSARRAGLDDPVAALTEPHTEPDVPSARKKSVGIPKQGSAGRLSNHEKARVASPSGALGKRRKIGKNAPTNARAVGETDSDDSDVESLSDERLSLRDARRRQGDEAWEKHAVARDGKTSRAKKESEKLSVRGGRASLGVADGANASVLPSTPASFPYATATTRAPVMDQIHPTHSVRSLDHREATNVDYMGADVVRDEPQMDAVVKVFCTHTEPNYSLPWQRKRQSASTSSGFIIDGRRVLTNAHSVEHHTVVKLKKRGDDKKYVARVLAIGVECDLALLTVDDDEFFAGTTPIDFGQLPSLQAAVTVVGYPIGGVAISVTSGVVSRIEVTSYSHGSSELLGLQIDAAINSGNSGGPAFNAQGGCVGVAFQSLKADDAENIGYVIPTPVIMHFIRDYEKNGKYTGFPTLPATWQKLENPNMRKFLKMTPAQKGVMVRRVDPVSPGSNKLKNGDVLLSFDGVEIANDGTVPFRTGERISFHYLVTEKFVGEKARVTFLRDGTTHAVDLPLTQVPRLVPVHIEGVPPSFYIAAGLVFTTVCVPYLKSEYGKDYDYDAPVPILNRLMYDQVTDKGQNVVVVAHVLSAPINIGYEDIVNTVVNGFNGKPVSNLKQLADMCDGCKDPFMRFELDHNLLVVLKTKEAHGATQDILKTHCIPSAKSQDLK